MADGRRIVIEFLGKDRSAGKTAQAVEAKFGKLGTRLDKVGQRAGKYLAGGLGAAATAAYGLGQKASDLAETQSKVVQVFGADSAKALDTFASSAATTIGQSKQSALDAAATFGMFGKSAGLAGNDLVGFSTDMTKLSSDMASFSNTSPEEAVEAIGAALRGESEPIRKYGVLLDDATLKARAMKLGIYEGTGALKPQQKVLAAQAEILAQTSTQQGDFARTSSGLANQQRILTAKLTNLGTEIGAKVLPAMVKMTEVGLKAVAWIGEHQRLVGTLAVVLGGFAAILYAVSVAMRAYVVVMQVWSAVTKVAAAVQKAWNLAMATNPIGLVVAALALLVIAIVIAYKKSDTFRKIVNAAFHGTMMVVKAVVTFLGNLIKSTWAGIVNVTKGATNVFRAVVRAAFGAVSAYVRAYMAVVRAIVTGVWSATRAVFTNGANAIVNLVRALPGKLRALGSLFAQAGHWIITSFVNGLKNAAGVVGGIAGNVWGALQGLLNGAIDRINSALSFTIHLPGPDLSINPPDIPHLAKGGVVRARQGGTLALLGEAGADEAVVPLSGPNAPKGLGMGGGVHFHGPVFGDPRAFAREVVKVLRAERRLTGQPLGIG